MQRQFTLRPSLYLAVALLAAHGVAVAALILLALPRSAKAALAFLVLLNLLHHLRRDVWLSAQSACMALMLDGDQVVLSTRSGEQLTGQLLRDSLVTPYLTVLNVSPQGARFARSVLILPDSLDAESFRKLRVWLTWGGQAAR